MTVWRLVIDVTQRNQSRDEVELDLATLSEVAGKIEALRSKEGVGS